MSYTPKDSISILQDFDVFDSEETIMSPIPKHVIIYRGKNNLNLMMINLLIRLKSSCLLLIPWLFRITSPNNIIQVPRSSQASKAPNRLSKSQYSSRSSILDSTFMPQTCEQAPSIQVQTSKCYNSNCNSDGQCSPNSFISLQFCFSCLTNICGISIFCDSWLICPKSPFGSTTNCKKEYAILAMMYLISN